MGGVRDMWTATLQHVSGMQAATHRTQKDVNKGLGGGERFTRTGGNGRLAIVGPVCEDIDTGSLGGPQAPITACVDCATLMRS